MSRRKIDELSPVVFRRRFGALVIANAMNVSYAEAILAGCVLTLPFLYESSQVFRYHLKFFVYYLSVMVVSLILIPVFAIKPRNVRNLLLASNILRHVSTLLGLRWIVRGREHLEKEQACIIVSNHQSSLDVLAMFDLWPIMDKCTVVAKRELLYAGPFGLGAWLCGLIFIPRMKTDTARAMINQAADKIIKNKIKLWVFPEGTRRNTGEIHPFKKGAFHLAISQHLPILPVVFSQYYFLDKESKRFDHGKIFVTTLPPISTEKLTLQDMDELIERTRNVMTTCFHETSKEMKETMVKQFSSQ